MKKKATTAKRATKDLEPRKGDGVKGGATASTEDMEANSEKITR